MLIIKPLLDALSPLDGIDTTHGRYDRAHRLCRDAQEMLTGGDRQFGLEQGLQGEVFVVGLWLSRRLDLASRINRRVDRRAVCAWKPCSNCPSCQSVA